MTETSSHEPAALALENVGSASGSVIALSDVSMSVPKNQVTCVLGDNGAGKSTLIKILSGVHAVGRTDVCQRRTHHVRFSA